MVMVVVMDLVILNSYVTVVWNKKNICVICSKNRMKTKTFPALLTPFHLIIIIPIFVLFWLGSTSWSSHNNLVNIQNRHGRLGGVRDRPVLGQKQIINARLIHVKYQRLTGYVEAKRGLALLMRRV